MIIDYPPTILSGVQNSCSGCILNPNSIPMFFLKALKAFAFSALYLIHFSSFAQEIFISGTVTSEEGPLPGVNIMVEGGTNGNITDMDGKYILALPNPDIRLVFSYVGYKTVHEYVGNRTVVDVFMEQDISQLDEVVVTGYTTQTVKSLSGAVRIVDTESMKKVPASNVSEQFQGRAPGVTVTNSGRPGAQPSVRVRGYGTINDKVNRKEEANECFDKQIEFLLKEIRLRTPHALQGFSYFELASVYANLGEKEKAYEILHEMEIGTFEGWAVEFIQIFYPFESLWEDEEFKEIIQRQEKKAADLRAEIDRLDKEGLL